MSQLLMPKKLKLKIYEDLQDLLELNHQKICPFHHRGLGCKSRKSEIPGITGKFGFGVQNEAGQNDRE